MGCMLREREMPFNITEKIKWIGQQMGWRENTNP